MQGEAWTVARIELLKKLWAAGETAAAIAARLGGMSRSAVLGKVFRLRLGADAAMTTSQVKRKSAINDRGKKSPPPARRRGGERDDRSPLPPAAGKPGKALLELTNNNYRWPHGRPGTSKFFFCGAAGADLEHGMPYCARHMRRAYGTSERNEEESGAAPSGGRRSSSPAPARFAPQSILISDERARPPQAVTLARVHDGAPPRHMRRQGR